MSDHDFPTRWRKEVLARARADLAKADRCLAALKVHDTPYYRAHVIAANMYRAALEAMERAGDESKGEAVPKRPAVKLPARRYLKDRTLGDDTFSTHAQGWDDALDAVEESLRAAGIPVEEGES